MNEDLRTLMDAIHECTEKHFAEQAQDGLQVRLTHYAAVLPSRATPGAAGYDFCALQPGRIAAGCRGKIGFGLQLAIPQGFEGKFEMRSSLADKYGLMVLGGVIDSDFRGEPSLIVFNSGDRPFEYEKHQRVCQLVLHAIGTPPVCLVETLPPTDRGECGFGSTGA